MRLLAAALAALLATAAGAADARQHYPARGHRIVPGSASPLDGFTAPSGAYSFRKLRSAYAGPAIRLRRASDNAETDINFLGCTGFTGCPWNEAAATSHCAATTCFVRTLYTQAGTFDLIQTTAANQPQLIFNCSGSLPCIRASAATTLLASSASITPAGTALTMSLVARRPSGTTQCGFFSENGASGNLLWGHSTLGQWRLAQAAIALIVGTATEAVSHAAVGVMDGTAASVLNIDGVETTGTSLSVVTTVAAPRMFGVGTSVCETFEAVFWDGYGMPAGERAALISNQRSWYGTP